MPHTSREIQLASRPVGEPTPENFRLIEVEVPDPGPGEVLVRNTFMSVDPYMRGRMNDVKSYVPPFALDEPMQGGAVGEVVASNDDELAVGDTVVHMSGWREYAVLHGKACKKIPADLASAYLGVLGMPGLTAYVGLLDVAELRDDDIVFVSGAAGAVGSLAGQIAKLRGHTVIGSAGGPEKVAHVVDDLGFDAAIDYRRGDLPGQLRDVAPKGIDVYFDNVGGDHLEAAIGHMRPHGRIALCGLISMYNATELPPGPNNMMQVVGRRITIRGFIVTDHAARAADFERDVSAWVRNGDIVVRETVVEGIERAPEAFLGLLRGANTGKMLVRLS
ncbi:NADP-dependent oxidoreductase [Svornostia abyssi]|uniref:NADP-dependent oxidoreductase n=1 Tax=Svornostia abyssi TaxID=2898438 RepID=A0ABY5PA86_9ACTN|nr:NADP-dependent oxidoreductase [Parviterribacteraceae bacterium J379]